MAIKFNFQYKTEMFSNLNIEVEKQKWIQTRYMNKNNISFLKKDSEEELMSNLTFFGGYLTDKDKIIVKYINPSLNVIFKVMGFFSKQVRESTKEIMNIDKRILPHGKLHAVQFRNFHIDGRTIREVNAEISNLYFANPKQQQLADEIKQIQYEAEVDAYCFDLIRGETGIKTVENIVDILVTAYPQSLEVCKDRYEIHFDVENRLEYIRENIHMFQPIMG